MPRTSAITRAQQQFDSGEFRAILARRIAIPTESQNPERAPALAQYLHDQIQPAFEAMGFECRTLTAPRARCARSSARAIASSAPTRTRCASSARSRCSRCGSRSAAAASSTSSSTPRPPAH